MRSLALARSPTLDLPRLHAVQAEVAASPARFRVLAAGRRWGKSLLGVSCALREAYAPTRDPWPVWWVAPSYKTALAGWDAATEAVSGLPRTWVDVEKGEWRIAFPWSRSPFQVRSADDPQALRSRGLRALVVDEAAYLDRVTWYQVLRPALSDTAGWALFISSPAGVGNWFHTLYERATRPGWARWQSPSWANPYLDPAEIEDARAEMDAATFSQEYGAQFLDLATVRPFRAEWWAEWTEAPPAGVCWACLGIDPAISTRDEACQTALVVAGVPIGRRPAVPALLTTVAHVLDVDAGHWTPYEAAGRILDLCRVWRPRTIRLEDVGYQRALGSILEREAPLRGIPLPAVDLVRPERDKLRRAMALSPLIESGRVLFGPGQAALKRALLAVPQDPSGWDLVDALGLAVTGLPLTRAPSMAIDPAGDARAREWTRAAGYATRVGGGGATPRQRVTHLGPTVGWRASRLPAVPVGRGAAGRRRAASYAVSGVGTAR